MAASATGSDGRVLCQKAGVTSHYFNKEDAFVRVGRVADLIDAIHNGVERRVVADVLRCRTNRCQWYPEVMQGKSYSSAKSMAPVSEPLPPITMSASMPSLRSVS